MELTITPEVEALLQHEMATGRFQNVNELIATAMHVLSDTTPADFQALDQMIDEGIESADRGELYTEDEARAYWRSSRAKL